ncbi:PhnB protein [Devosia sp. LC5]|uniref:YciI family protein n=1 Tax=Devosia sp. LC5 TaxID=1502724 RepID=UPI0004E3370E|nr:YciI family protein [Devosia sp. LC5]KFC62416.1 PhnB protein [Devosia sp. LC5]
MRFMILVKATPETEAGIMPTASAFAAMEEYNEALIDAGVLLHCEGLMASSQGTRLRFDGERITVTEGPFTQTRELLCGFWLIDVKSHEEALAWCRRIPFDNGEEIELRQVFETADFAVNAVA